MQPSLHLRGYKQGLIPPYELTPNNIFEVGKVYCKKKTVSFSTLLNLLNSVVTYNTVCSYALQNRIVSLGRLWYKQNN